MKTPSLKNNFAGHIRERGLDYHKKRRVRDLLINENTVTATVLGNKNYRVRINLKNDSMKCTCDFNCKHEAAVLYALRSSKNIEKAAFAIAALCGLELHAVSVWQQCCYKIQPQQK